MRTIDEIRFHNFGLLLLECGGEARGSATKLAMLTGVPQALISQIRNRTPHPSGVPRGIGDETARKLERGMNKQSGWMDRDHGEAATVNEADLLDLFRDLTPEQRIALLETARQLGELNRFKRPPPPGTGDLPPR